MIYSLRVKICIVTEILDKPGLHSLSAEKTLQIILRNIVPTPWRSKLQRHSQRRNHRPQYYFLAKGQAVAGEAVIVSIDVFKIEQVADFQESNQPRPGDRKLLAQPHIHPAVRREVIGIGFPGNPVPAVFTFIIKMAAKKIFEIHKFFLYKRHSLRYIRALEFGAQSNIFKY